MNTWRIILRGLVHHWRMNLAVALGVMAGTAVLVGALLVGDSVRGSLRHLTLDRLGRIDTVLVASRFFRQELAEELANSPEVKKNFAEVVPGILLEASIESPANGHRASGVVVVGSKSGFWYLFPGGDGEAPFVPNSDEVVLNAAAAAELGVAVGNEIILRLPRPSDIPADSPLGKKTETIRNRRLKVVGIIPAEGMGRFGLRPNQQLPKNAFVRVETLQKTLDVPGRVNSLFIAGKQIDRAATPDAEHALADALQPTLADFGLRFEKTSRDYVNLTAERMLVEPAVVRAAEAAFQGRQIQPALTYLANTIATGDREIPYSTITAIDPVAEPPLGPFVTSEGKPLGKIGDDEIVLNSWAAENLAAKPGDMIRVAYFRPESTHGRVEETSITLRLADVVRLEGAAADHDLTPSLKGVTDQVTMATWDVPFPFEASRIRSEDEDYWDEYRATPKAFVSLATGRRLWGSRFGDTTSLRIAGFPPDATAAQSATNLKIDPAALGFQFQPVKRFGLLAASGTTPFNLLFLGFSFFIIAGAIMLVALLCGLTIEQRAVEIGTLLALGLAVRQVRRILVTEGLLIALIGGAIGVALGVGYAAIMLEGLRTWWVAAITSPFVRLYVSPASFAIGYASGVVVSWLAIWWTVRRLRKLEVRELLAGRASRDDILGSKRVGFARAVGYAALGAAVVLLLLATRLSGEAQAGTFFGSGALALVGLLTLLRIRLRAVTTGAIVNQSTGAIPRLAVRNAARHPGRSTLSIGLVAVACFLIIAISTFRLAPPEADQVRDSGTGGFALVAQSDQPIYQDLASPSVWSGIAGGEELRAAAKIYSVRVRPGDDASCLNLYQSVEPRVLGLPDALIHRGGFAWAGTLAETPDEKNNPWLLLEKDWGQAEGGEAIVPIVLDAATAMYSLHLRGVGARYELAATDRATGQRRQIPCLVVGLLQTSVLQGDVLMSEQALLRLFPDTGGYEFFLVDAPADKTAAIETTMEGTLGDFGFDAQRAGERLAGYLVVQNTYLATFQSLGGLGLLLGTLGLAVVELRNVFERRGELALLRAVGFRRRSLAWLVLCENFVLLVAGLSIGLEAALLAVAPHWWAGTAGMPWRFLASTLAIVLLTGGLTGLVAVWAMLRAPLIEALRGE